jgi:2-iminobutanoate/2-iminopropanoate deaminase
MPSTRREALHTSRAPEAVGPYSQAVKWGDLVFVSGMGPLDPATGQVVGESFAAQVRRTLDNLQAVLEDAGSSMGNVLKAGVFLQDIEQFREFNEIYATYFAAEPPARTTVQAARLPLDFDIEVDAIACVDQDA